LSLQQQQLPVVERLRIHCYIWATVSKQAYHFLADLFDTCVRCLLLCLQIARLGITGMTCAACSGSVERALQAMPGVTRVGVSLPTGEAEVTHHPSSITAEALVAAVEDLGFEARLISKAGLETCSLGVLGMTCSACSSAVESALCAVPGVSSASVSALAGRAEVWYDASTTGPRAFLQAIDDAGFVGSLLAGDDSRGSDAAAELAEWGNLLSMALVFTIPVFILAMVLPMLPGESALTGFVGPLLCRLDYMLVSSQVVF
jgi:Cu+-exporting ATPase